MAKQSPSLSAAVAAAVLLCCCCVVCVVSEVKLLEGHKHINSNDPTKYKDCSRLQRAGYNTSGVYQLHLNATWPVYLRCEFTKDNAYTVIQRRQDYTVNFMQTLDTYRSGFGFAQTNYWAGLDAINHLTTAARNNKLTIYMQDSRGTNRNAQYNQFMVQGYAAKYAMTASGFYGPGLQDDLSHSNGMPFHTYDIPDTNKCATQMKAGWWYNYCAFTLPNGYFYKPGIYQPSSQYFDGMYWESFGGYNNGLKFFSMSVSP